MIKNKNISRLLLKKISLFIVSFIILFLGFQYNYFGVANQKFFDTFQNDSEALVVGRLVKTSNDGLFSAHAGLGKYSGGVQHQTELYLNNEHADNFHSYTSQFGLQGIFYGITDKVLNTLKVKPKNKLEILHGVTSAFIALIFATVIMLFYFEVGFAPVVFLLFGIGASQWLTVMGRNLYWVFGIMYLPFLITFASYKYEEIYNKLNFKFFYTAIFLAVLVKSLNGYEYISTVMLAMVSPIVYFAVKNRWSSILTVKRIFITGLFGLFGFFAALGIHITQLYTVTHSISKAWEMILARILVRTYGNPDNFNPVYAKSLLASVFEVYHRYTSITVIEFKNIFGWQHFHAVTFGDLLWVFVLVTALSFIKSKSIQNNQNKLMALVASTWFSFLAPLSWYTLAKGHSYIHTHINIVLVYLPFSIFGFLLLGFVVSLFMKDLIDKNKTLFVAILVGILLSISFNFISSIKKSNEKTDSLFKQEKLIEISPKKNIKLIVTNDGNLIYHISHCNSSSIADRFFLHISPKNENDLKNKKYAFNNYDFKWHQYAIDIPKFSEYTGSCIAVRKLPAYIIETITTGRYKGSTRFWQKQIEMTSISKKADKVSAFNLSNKVWKNGISNTKPALFTNNTLINRLSLKENNILKFPFSGERTITKIDVKSKYINIEVNGTKLDPIKDGYPNQIKILKGNAH